MGEKISDKPIREVKVKELKERILTEIDEELELIRFNLRQYSLEDKYYDMLIKQGFALLSLKRYVGKENTFMLYEAEYPDEDAIVYKVPEKNLDIWLQEDYSFVSNFLFEAEEHGYNVFPLLSDHYFGYHFMSVFELIIFDKKDQQE